MGTVRRDARFAGLVIFREAALLAAAGVAGGWIATLIAGRWMGSVPFETSRADPLVLGAAGALMLAIALLRRSFRRDRRRANPAELLRS